MSTIYKGLREDNTLFNCTVHTDLFPMEGRKHNWMRMSNNWQVCSTCGREVLRKKAATERNKEAAGDEKAI